MTVFPAMRRRTFEAPCTVEIERSADTLASPCRDRQRFRDPARATKCGCIDAPTDAPYGERIVVRRGADVTRAGLLGAGLDPDRRQLRTHRTLRRQLHRKEETVTLPSDAATAFDATRAAQENTLLSPRFYTTDFAELDRIDVSRCARNGTS